MDVNHQTKVTRFCVVLLIGFMAFPFFATAQDVAIALYLPDFQAIRKMVNPQGELNLPQGPRTQATSTAWRQISKPGRDLLLKERDLAVVVVNRGGMWSYRSTGLYNMRALSTTGPSDYQNLSDVLQDELFEQLRAFFRETLFKGTPVVSRVGEILNGVESLPNASQQQKDWFASVVGEEVLSEDEATRTQFLSDATYGASFAQAVSRAATIRDAQAAAIAQGSTVTSAAVTLNDFGWPRFSGTGSTFRMAWGRAPTPIRSAGSGKTVWVSSTPSGTLYMLSEPGALASWFDADTLPQLVNQGKVSAFLATPGGGKVYRVNPGSN